MLLLPFNYCARTQQTRVTNIPNERTQNVDGTNTHGHTKETMIFFSGWREIRRTTKADGGSAADAATVLRVRTVFARATAVAVGGRRSAIGAVRMPRRWRRVGGVDCLSGGRTVTSHGAPPTGRAITATAIII